MHPTNHGHPTGTTPPPPRRRHSRSNAPHHQPRGARPVAPGAVDRGQSSSSNFKQHHSTTAVRCQPASTRKTGLQQPQAAAKDRTRDGEPRPPTTPWRPRPSQSCEPRSNFSRPLLGNVNALTPKGAKQTDRRGPRRGRVTGQGARTKQASKNGIPHFGGKGILQHTAPLPGGWFDRELTGGGRLLTGWVSGLPFSLGAVPLRAASQGRAGLNLESRCGILRNAQTKTASGGET